MKKAMAVLGMVLLVLCLWTSCADKDDYAAYPFVGVEWTRSAEHDTESLYFSEDGTFHYSCACGNPVNDADLCDGFSYDADTNIITLQYTDVTDETVTALIVKSCTDEELVLDFDGEIRTFTTAEETVPSDVITCEGKEYLVLPYPSDIFCYNLSVGGECEEDTVYVIEHDRWDMVQYNGDVFVLHSDINEATAYYADDKNYDWWVRVENIESESAQTRALSVTADELAYLYDMENHANGATLFFEEIETFATFAKTSKDGLITATIELAWHDDAWYWRSEIIDEKTEGWPEYIVTLPLSLNERIGRWS